MIDTQKVHEDQEVRARIEGYGDAACLLNVFASATNCAGEKMQLVQALDPSQYLLNALRDLACASHPLKQDYLDGWQKRMDEHAA